MISMFSVLVENTSTQQISLPKTDSFGFYNFFRKISYLSSILDVGGELGRYGSQSSTQSTDNLLEIDDDQRQFAMELCSLGKRGDPCSAIEWAPNTSVMVPLISCKADMSSWRKAKYPGSGASGIRGRPGEMTSGSFRKRVSNYACLVA